MKVILYVRVSTHEQTSTHQLHQAKAAGFSQIDEVSPIMGFQASAAACSNGKAGEG